MTEIIIYGRGGQGGVTLAKLIAALYFRRGRHVQAFGVYAAERSGAPLQAFVRIAEEPIQNRNQVNHPDHVVVLDRTLIGPQVAGGLQPGGWLLLNSREGPEAYAETFPGYRLATVDGARIALDCGLGTRTTPIVNTTLLGAVARIFGEPFAAVEAALEELGFGGPNREAARRAYEEVRMGGCPDAPPLRIPRVGRPGLEGPPPPAADRPPRLKTGGWATQRPHRRRYTPPCNHGCPAGNNIRDFVAAVSARDLEEALRILHETSPLPGVCGRVCPAPCMDACHRNRLDESVNIRELERYVGDHVERPRPSVRAERQAVAVVGSGPAGLSAAYHLARLGYRVTLFEARDELGGVMRTGIPPYRLPRAVLDREIAYILAHGVEVKTGAPVDRPGLLALTRRYAALFVATGLQELRRLRLGAAPAGTVLEGVAFLDRVRRGEVCLMGEAVAVIGGGNTAVDAARSALRVGARRVTVVYRRTRAEMPALKEEIEEMLEEGVSLRELLSPEEIQTRNGRPVLVCRRMRLGPPDESGRRRPEPEPGAGAIEEVPCDRVILALGQRPDLTIFPEGAELRDGGRVVGVAEAPVFAGGDLVTNEGTVAAAIGGGRTAAWHIHRTLGGEDLWAPAPPVTPPEVMAFQRFESVPRHRGVELPVPERLRGFQEVRRGLPGRPDHAVAAAEAERCLSCGVCNQCDLCALQCPEGIVRRSGDDYLFDYEYCKGCGVCAFECPRGVTYMEAL